MRKHISIFALLLSAFTVIGSAAADAQVSLWTYYRDVDSSIKESDGKIVVPTGASPILTGDVISMSCNPGSGKRAGEWWLYANSGMGVPQTPIRNIGTGKTCSYTYSAKDGTDLSAVVYLIKTYAITASVSPTGAGTVTVEGGNDDGTVDAGGNVKLTAKPNTGWKFSKWSDDNTENPRTISNISADATYTAMFAKKTVDLTLDLKEGVSRIGYKTESESDYTYVTSGKVIAAEYGATYDLIAEAAGGWGFDGASTKSQTFSNITAAQTFAPVPTRLPNTVTFDRNGGEGGTDSVQVTYGSDMPSITVPTRTGYDFAGYFTTADGGTPYYTKDGASCQKWNRTEPTTLYAHWNGYSYKIVYAFDGGKMGYDAPTTAQVGKPFHVSAPTKDGYTFAGWKVTGVHVDYGTARWGISSDVPSKIGSDETVCFNGANGNVYFTDLTTTKDYEVTLRATWTRSEYQLTVHPNGGTYRDSTGPTTLNEKLYYGATNVNSIGVAERTGYTLSGYSTESNGGETVFDAEGKCKNGSYWSADYPDGIYRKMENLRVYAQWAIITYSVGYAPGDFAKETAKYSAAKEYGRDLTLRGSTYTRTGYTQDGWSKATDGSTLDFALGGSYGENAAVTLYPHWKPNEYELTINPNGGKYDGKDFEQTQSAKLVYDGTSLNQILVATHPERKPLQGYWTSSSGGKQVYDESGHFVPGDFWTENGEFRGTGNLRVYAMWGDPKKTYSVTVTASPAEAGTVDPSGTGTYVEGSNIVLTATENTGYSFWHWTKGGEEVSTAKEYPITVTADAEYVAVFTGNVYTVTYRTEGGHPENPKRTVTFGSPYGEPPAVAKDGYDLVGWFTDYDGEGVRINPDTPVETAKNHNLIAYWEEKTAFTVTFADPDGGHESIPAERTKGQPIGEPAKGTENWLRDGYWHDNSLDWDPPLTTVVTDNMTVNAKWTSIADVLDCTNLMFNVGVGAHWEVCRDDFVVGDSCMRLVFSDGNDHLSTKIPGPGTLSFNWKVGSGNLHASTNGNNDIWSKDGGQKWTKAEKEELVFPGPCDLTFYSQLTGPRSCLIDNVTWTPKGEEVKYTLTVESGGNGAVAKNPDQAEYVEGTPVMISATPSADYAFEKWSDGSTANPRQIVVTSNATYVATFVALPPDEYTLEVLSGGHGIVAKEPNQAKYVEDTPVTIAATPDAGYAFEKWNDGVTESSRQIVVTSNAVYTATFTNCSYVVTFDAAGGTASENEKVVKYGEAYGNLPTAKKSGGIFIGWFLGDAEIEPETPVSTSHDHTLVAKWKQDVGEVSAALDCNNLAFEKTGGWTIENDHGFAYTEKGGNDLYLKTTSVDAGSGISVTVTESGTLTFHWRAKAAKGSFTEFVAKVNDVEVDRLSVTGNNDSGWVNGSIEVTANKIPATISFAGIEIVDYCALDYVTWTPEGGGEPTPGDPVKPTATRMEGNVFSLTIPTESNKDYGVWTNADLTVDSWGLMGDPQPGKGQPLEFKWTILPGFPQLFFRAHKVEYK